MVTETFKKFRQFFLYIKNQHRSSIHIVRSNNSTEFTSLDFQIIIKTNDIHHHLSYTYTPQQNGKVEKKHRHILQVARSLMLQSHIPLKFWGECILTFVHPFNRTPSVVIDNETPYYRLFRKHSKLSHLKVFGCWCYATNNRHKSKFDPRSIKGVFLDYSLQKKGYYILDLEYHNIITSRDVYFFEESFPFKDTPVDRLLRRLLSRHSN